jgi:hypothetical protein
MTLRKDDEEPIFIDMGHGRGGRGFAKKWAGQIPASFAMAMESIQREAMNVMNLVFAMDKSHRRLATATTLVPDEDGNWVLPERSLEIAVKLLRTATGRDVFELSTEAPDSLGVERRTCTLYARALAVTVDARTPITDPDSFEYLDVARMAVFTASATAPGTWTATALPAIVMSYELDDADGELEDQVKAATSVELGDALRNLLPAVLPENRHGVLPLPNMKNADDGALEDGEFRISDAGGFLDCETLQDPRFFLRSHIDDFDRIDHDDWTTVEYGMFVYPPEGDHRSEGGASGDAKCGVCKSVPPAEGQKLCSRCESNFALWAEKVAAEEAAGPAEADQEEEDQEEEEEEEEES